MIRMMTDIDDRGITYVIEVNGLEHHRRRVEFGRDRRHRAAGAAFVEAAREQEKIARGFAAPSTSIIETIRRRDS
jgi:hypothetical protein